MKKPVILVFIMVLLMFLVLGCGKRGYLQEQDFNLYDSDGKLYIDANDMPGQVLTFGEGGQTFRGLKIGDTVTKFKELYGEEIMFYRVDGKIMDAAL